VPWSHLYLTCIVPWSHLYLTCISLVSHLSICRFIPTLSNQPCVWQGSPELGAASAPQPPAASRARTRSRTILEEEVVATGVAQAVPTPRQSARISTSGWAPSYPLATPCHKRRRRNESAPSSKAV